MQRVRRLAIGLVLVILVSPRLRAQEPTFHAGQWGAEAGIGAGNAATLLRFVSSSSAWMATFSGAVQSFDVEAPGSGTSTNTTIWNTALRLGYRSYSGTTAVRPFHTFGAFGNYLHGHDDNSTQHSWSAGGFFELGASWLLNSHVGLGASGEADVGYTDQENEINLVPGGTQTLSAKGWFANVGQIRVLASVYF